MTEAGNSAEEYKAAVEGVAVLDRSQRTRFRIAGPAAAQMLQGLLSGRIPGAPRSDGVVEPTRWEYSLVLTAKGRIISDLRLARLGGDDEVFLFDVPAAGAVALGEHFSRSLPPRLARAQEVSKETGMLTVMGPQAASILSRDALGLRVEEADLLDFEEGDGVRVTAGEGLGIAVIRSTDLATTAFDVVADLQTITALWTRLLESGVTPTGPEVFHKLRVEAGRPAFGVDIDENTIPFEAGVEERGIDHAKGCYTGQEVIVRIRDRGHVNRHLRGLVLAEGQSSSAGAVLFAPGKQKSVGVITSVAESARAGTALALGYVRREVEVPGAVRLGSEDGAEVEVRELYNGWAF